MTRFLHGLVVVGLLLVTCQKDSRLVPAQWALLGEEGKTPMRLTISFEDG
jgi:hypothetical protein